MRYHQASDILVTNRLGIISEHVQASHVKDLVQFSCGSLVLRARDGGGQLGTSGLISKEGLRRRAKVRGGADGAGSRHARHRAQSEAGASNGGHYD